MPALPDGPLVWICGDCHVGHLGPVADRKGNIAVQIRDLDQTTFGNPAQDIVRLALTLASVARSSNLPGVTTVRIVENMNEGYEAGLASLDHEEAANPRRPPWYAVPRSVDAGITSQASASAMSGLPSRSARSFWRWATDVTG